MKPFMNHESFTVDAIDASGLGTDFCDLLEGVRAWQRGELELAEHIGKTALHFCDDVILRGFPAFSEEILIEFIDGTANGATYFTAKLKWGDRVLGFLSAVRTANIELVHGESFS